MLGYTFSKSTINESCRLNDTVKESGKMTPNATWKRGMKKYSTIIYFCTTGEDGGV